ncbi:MAG: valine--tRNA ligase [Patescibacteria group bacterium]|nr:valine--tRNA ligase [Patescibacteria group bacterium]
MNLSKSYNSKTVEDRIYRFWLKSGFFNPDNLPKKNKKSYTIVLPPPNVTGELHMGHALNALIQDVLIRQKRMNGYLTLWLPGTDHAGIATQVKVEKELKKQGLTRYDLGRKDFIKMVWQWKKKYGNIILKQLKKLGLSCDWSRIRFTMDKNYSRAVKQAFSHYYKKGWIYKGKRVVNWCPRCQTSLSDLEIEYKEEKGKLYYIKYPLKIINKKQRTIDNEQGTRDKEQRTMGSEQGTRDKEQRTMGSEQGTRDKEQRTMGSEQGTRNKEQRTMGNKFIVVATTRPETMFGDTAVAVNPKDEKYKNLIGEKAVLPLTKREIPIISDILIDKTFGTGAVKITPSHDLKDCDIGSRHNLKSIQVIDEKGKMFNCPSPYQGIKTLEARQKVIESLEKISLLEKIEDYNHEIPKCERCGKTIELIPSEQWFLKMKELAQIAKISVKKGKIKFHPKKFEKSYFDWLGGIKDWCISRQIWWGHQLPIWECQKEKQQSQNLKEKYFVSLEKPKKCSICGKCRPKQVNDVLDTWFSSALWPFASLGWPRKTKDLKKFYPTNVLSTGRDIINLWVARMIFSGLEFTEKIPFKDVYVHATVLNKEGKRMSKSLGTGVDPMDLIEKYGADATRFGIAYQIMGGQDIKFIENNIIMGKKFCNKLWNASRFVLQQTSSSKRKAPHLRRYEKRYKQEILKTEFKTKNLTKADKKILTSLEITTKSVNKDLENFLFGKAAHTLYDFFWHNFCDVYIEESKKQNKETTEKILLYVLLTSLKLLHPFIPFITEEIYQKLPLKKEKSIIIENWPI